MNTFLISVSCCLLLILQGCSSNPPSTPRNKMEPVPELTLNLPQQNCACTEEEPRDYTFLEKGLRALEAGEHLEALQYFQRYQRIENNETADIEAGIAVAYLSVLPNSPIYDGVEARKSYRKLRSAITSEIYLHQQITIMRDSLETFVIMEREIEELREANSALQQDLNRREEAIRRLRDLTLGN